MTGANSLASTLMAHFISKFALRFLIIMPQQNFVTCGGGKYAQRISAKMSCQACTWQVILHGTERQSAARDEKKTPAPCLSPLCH